MYEHVASESARGNGQKISIIVTTHYSYNTSIFIHILERGFEQSQAKVGQKMSDTVTGTCSDVLNLWAK